MGNAASSEWKEKALYVAWKLAVYEICHFHHLEEHWALGNLLDTGLAQELASFVFLFSCLRPGSERFLLLWAVWSISTAWLYRWAQTQPLGVCELHGWPAGCSLLTPGWMWRTGFVFATLFYYIVLLYCTVFHVVASFACTLESFSFHSRLLRSGSSILILCLLLLPCVCLKQASFS